MVIALTPPISLDGAPLEDSWQAALLESRVELQFQVPGRVTVRFLDPGYQLAAKSKVKLGTTIKITDPSDSSLVLFEGEATAVGVEQHQANQPELVVVGHDRSHRMGRATNVKSYLSMRYSEVVRTLATSAGLKPQIDSTDATVDYLLQADSDLGLLTELARRVGFDWWVEGLNLNFKKPTAGGTITLSLGNDLLSFSARASGHHPDEVTVDGWDRGQQQQVTVTASQQSPGVAASSEVADLANGTARAYGSATLLTAGVAARNQAEAQALSQAIYDRGRACAVTARGTAPGNGRIGLSQTVKIADAGPLSGTYPVTSVEHIFRPAVGYVTRFRSGDRRPTSLVDTLSGAAQAGPAHHHPGVSVGIVTNVNDETKSGMVRVRYPGVNTNEETGWARLVAIGGGSSRGMVFVPEVNDEVLVAFEGGDPRQPVVIGGLYSSRAKIPENPVNDGKVENRAFTSRLGHVITLLDGDEDAKQAIELQLTGKQHTIHLGKDQLNVAVPAGTPVNVTAGESKITIGKDGAMNLEASNITIKATEQLQLQAPTVKVTGETQLSLESQASASLKGAQLQVQGEGPVTIGGATVAIN
jgi:phage protein D/phage baseplate assembly protein gpV